MYIPKKREKKKSGRFFYYKSFLANFTNFEPEIRPKHANIGTFRSIKE